jgi:putative peptidoglycan lipid II flippase
MSAGVSQLNLFISQSAASFINGAVSIMSYADRIYQFPLSIIGVAFGTILLPYLSRIKDDNNRSKVTTDVMVMSLIMSLPTAICIALLSQAIIDIVYFRGHFTKQNTIDTAIILQIFALSLPASIMSKVITPAFYARGYTLQPLYIATLSLLCNAVLCFTSSGINSIATASSISAYVHLLLLVIFGYKLKLFNFTKSNLLLFFKVMIVSAIICAQVIFLKLLFYSSLSQCNFVAQTVSLFCIIIIAAFTYILGVILCGIFSLKEMYLMFKK